MVIPMVQCLKVTLHEEISSVCLGGFDFPLTYILTCVFEVLDYQWFFGGNATKYPLEHAFVTI